MTIAGCRAITPELCSIVWLGKFKLDLPPCYDSTPNPAEFYQLYEVTAEPTTASPPEPLAGVDHLLSG